MQTKPILIGFASAILLLIVAGASFSAGLYFGQRGYVDGLQYQQQQTGAAQGQPGAFPNGQFPQNQGGQYPNGQAPQNQGGQFPNGQAPQGNAPQGGPGAGGPPGAPSWPPDVMGRLVSFSATEIVLDTPNGSVTVPVNADTQYLNQQGEETTADQLQVGQVVAIFGRPTAASVMILPPPPNQQP